jgi:hypothetical protein
MINPATGAITEFPFPTAGSWPYYITEGPDGNLWFTTELANVIGMISPSTHAITEFATSKGATGITAGPDGNLWFTEGSPGKIAEINPTTHAITEFPIPNNPNSAPWGITAGPDGNIWFADWNGSAIGVVTLPAPVPQLVVTQPPPTSVTAGAPFTLTVQAEDGSGHVVSSFDGTVTVALANSAGGATLGGTLSVTAADGAATFSGLTLNKAGSGYTLEVSGSGFTGTTTNALTVTPVLARFTVPTSGSVVPSLPALAGTAAGNPGDAVTVVKLLLFRQSDSMYWNPSSGWSATLSTFPVAYNSTQ